MGLIKKPSELSVKGTLSVLIYGQPGIGKTTFGVSAPDAVLFDYDGGVQRINGAHQVPTLQPTSWEDTNAALKEIAEEMPEVKTIVIDTAGKMLDFMSDYIMRNDPKMKMRDGSLALKGYGQRKVMFVNLLKRVSMMGKHIVFVAHEKEDKDGETRIVRPDMSGSSLGDLIKELDLVGYMQAYGRDRNICWTPNEQYYAKNTCNLPEFEKVPVIIDAHGGIAGENDYLTKTFDNYAAYLKQQAKIGDDYTALVDQIAADIAAITDADGANAFIAKIDDYGHIWDSKAKARRLFADHMAKVENVTYDKKTKRYAAKG